MENISAPRRTGRSWQSVTPQVRDASWCSLPPHPPPPPSSSHCFTFCRHCLPGEDEQLTLKLINRPMLILRGENGFICHHRNSNTLDASRSIYDIFSLQFSNGAYHIKGQVVCFIIYIIIYNIYNNIYIYIKVCVTLWMPPFKSRRCGRQVLVREQRRAGVLRRWGARGFLSGTAGARSPRHPWQERKIPAWRPRRNTEGRRTQPEQLSPVGVLTWHCLNSEAF